ncbi:hypothetical protein D1007_33434 [Hordeum vulgare]|nr:hypothetical protein D1007_33434 [Hordeum vulgare]
MENGHNLFDTMPTMNDEANRLFMESIIFEGGGGSIPFNPDETQSQDDRAPFMADHEGMGNKFGEDNGGMADPFMKDRLDMGISFLLEHEFLKDYGLDEKDHEVDINGEP